MKRILILTKLFMLMALSVHAQELTNKHEISFRVGSLLGAADSNWDGEEYDKFSPMFSLGYLYQINKVWSVGGGISYLYCRSRESESYYCYYDCNAPQSNQDDWWVNIRNWHKYTDHFVSIVATAKAKWARHRIWNMYSRVSVGPAIVKNNGIYSTSSIHAGCMFQVSPLGFEIGNDHIRGSIELPGIGFEGYVIAGILYKF